ncbi:hypothetical protein ACFO3J_20745 [Streptomyces polygonati]|uniref:SnoaL-like domain-containing protein n=1 Tax=Streptomyces polygonati TaxID=1617087 RepID=A0ABV8HPR6_9ACTN
MYDSSPQAGPPGPGLPPDRAVRGSPPSYRAAGLIPAAGRVRTLVLAMVGIPLLLVLTVAFVRGTGSGGSAGQAADVRSGITAGADGGTPQPARQPSPAASSTQSPSLQPSTVAPSTAQPSTTAYPTAPTAPAGQTPASPPLNTDTPAPAPDTTVNSYYAAINRRDFTTAWSMGGKNLDPTYAGFVAGFADTVLDTLTVVSVQGDTVSVTLDSLQANGARHSYSGAYRVHGGVIVGGHLVRTA